eukprot:TRINITY_DN4746_c1_g3_i1.p1 TRINITY_DN4746_c1_g3~~TRINITY_DN4746_c1_g3_i1.p1  ORF type:complete len:270 (+),score=30.42 TRINITY_DN4746_c1_g3_i1:94-903(+)
MAPLDEVGLPTKSDSVSEHLGNKDFGFHVESLSSVDDEEELEDRDVFESYDYMSLEPEDDAGFDQDADSESHFPQEKACPVSQFNHTGSSQNYENAFHSVDASNGITEMRKGGPTDEDREKLGVETALANVEESMQAEQKRAIVDAFKRDLQRRSAPLGAEKVSTILHAVKEMKLNLSPPGWAEKLSDEKYNIILNSGNRTNSSDDIQNLIHHHMGLGTKSNSSLHWSFPAFSTRSRERICSVRESCNSNSGGSSNDTVKASLEAEGAT